jgi:hypothetical protein
MSCASSSYSLFITEGGRPPSYARGLNVCSLSIHNRGRHGVVEVLS